MATEASCKVEAMSDDDQNPSFGLLELEEEIGHSSGRRLVEIPRRFVTQEELRTDFRKGSEAEMPRSS